MVAKDHPERVVLNAERLKHWLGVGAQPSDRVARFLGQAGLAPAPTIPEQTRKNQPRKRAQERMKAEAAAAAAAPAAAPAAPVPAAAAVPAAPEAAVAAGEGQAG
jgi:small subunit ribosomal protein S16